MRAPALNPVHVDPADDEVITAADIEAWVRVERALTVRRMACRTARAAVGRMTKG